MKRIHLIVILSAVVWLCVPACRSSAPTEKAGAPCEGCSAGKDAPAEKESPHGEFIQRVDSEPPEERPKDWERTKALMGRRAPAVGEAAPDFTLKTSDGRQSVKLSEYHPDKPRVLIFGSYT
jgi:hypothetical protein